MRVQNVEQLLERRALRPEHRRRIPPVEEHLHLGRQLVEEALDVEAVAGAVGQERDAGSHAAELAVAGRLLALGDALLHELARLEHLERDEAVERREGGIAQVVGDRLRGAHAGGRLCSIAATILSRWKTCRGDRCAPAFAATDAGAHVRRSPLKLRGEVLLEQLAGRWVARSMALRVSLSIPAPPTAR